MTISLNPARLKRYKDIARLFLKYGRSDLVKQATLGEVLPEPSTLEWMLEFDHLHGWPIGESRNLRAARIV